ncbi:MAG: Rieske 2Fe-2S domain-containing protein [Planctomycetaceae bacterium]
MPDRVRIDSSAALAPGDRRSYALGGRMVAVFNVGGQLFAIDDLCPHRGGSLGSGSVVDGHVVCPLHGWRFDVATGACPDRPGERVRTHAVFAAGDDLFVELSDADDPGENAGAAADGIHRYLVRYGALGWVGRFGSIERIECGIGDRVAVATSRGVEVGELLAVSTDGAPVGDLAGRPAGEVLRPLAADEAIPDEPRETFDTARRLAAERGLPVEFVDCERLLDGETVVLYYVGEADARLDELRGELARDHAAALRCDPLFDAPAPTGGGCGKEGCGGGGCGA